MLRYWQKFTLVAVLTLFLAACASPAQAPAPTDLPPAEEEIQEEMPSEDEIVIGEEEEEKAPEIDAAAIYTARCARCHGADRSGGRYPTLLPTSLTQDPSVYEAIITNGSGGMPSFGNRLSADEIGALVEFILSDPQ